MLNLYDIYFSLDLKTRITIALLLWWQKCYQFYKIFIIVVLKTDPGTGQHTEEICQARGEISDSSHHFIYLNRKTIVNLSNISPYLN